MSGNEYLEALMQENKTLGRTIPELTRVSEKKDELMWN